MTDRRGVVSTQQRQLRSFGGSLPSRILMVVSATAFMAFGLVSAAVGVRFAAAPVAGTDRRDWFTTVLMGPPFVALAVATRRIARRAVLVDGSGVTLIAFWRTRQWAWSQISSVGMECVYDDDVGMRYWPRLTLVTGATVHLRVVTSASRKGTSKAARTLSLLRLGLLKSGSASTNRWVPARPGGPPTGVTYEAT
jgi:hypothetical protein